MEQLYLEQLIVKPMPKKQGNIMVKFKDIHLPKDKEMVEETPTIVNVKIVDKRNVMNVNRQLVIDRLKDKNIFQIRRQEPPRKAAIIGSEITKINVKKPIKMNEVVEIVAEEEEEKVEVEDEEKVEVEEEKVEEEKVEKVEEDKVEVEEVKKRGKKKLAVPSKTFVPEMNEKLKNMTIGKHTVSHRLPPPQKIIMKTSPYYMNNRRIFIQKLREMFKDYSKELEQNADISCSKKQKEEVTIMTHQKIVRDYMNLYTPYRGLLLYHALGSGKTATSIAIAEGMKSAKSIIVLTPASLKMNFFSEIKRYGDLLYRKNQYWEFISIEGKPEYIDILENVLSLPRETFIKNRGAWMIDVTKPPNFSELNSIDQESIDDQLNQMIRAKYIDINYNGLTKNKMSAITSDYTVNPFDDKVVIIDEAHNFVSRIVNKIKQPGSISYKLYDYLMKAKNARIVLLTGTPIINYPNEIGILFNILRGSIKTWSFPVTVKTGDKVNKEQILKIFDDEGFKHYDYVEYSDNKLIVTRNPFGFFNTKKRGAPAKKMGGDATTLLTSLLNGGKTKKKSQMGKDKKEKKKTKKNRKGKDDVDEPYTLNNGIIKINYHPEEKIEDDARVDVLDRVAPQYHKGGENEFEKYNGVKLDESGGLTDEDFVKEIKRILKKNKMEVIEGLIDIKYYKALPDDSESFLSMFVDIETGSMKNENVFKKRILGLTSYFRSAQEKLLPSFVENEEPEYKNSNKNIHVLPVEMSEHQFASYVKIRKEEIDQEQQNRKNKAKQEKKGNDDDIYKISSTYRIFSRAACNFTFPADIERPLPDREGDEMNEDDFDSVPKNILLETDVYVDEEDLEKIPEEPLNYKKRIDAALNMLSEGDYLTKENLEKYSPKFVKLLENIQSDENPGLHLIYSQFRTIEGIGILKLILEANGYAEFKIKKNISTDKWEIVEKAGDEGKPHFVLYTGTESADEKEVIRNIYNSNWAIVPPELVQTLEKKSSNNQYGEIIKLFMITSSGAEGINLKNTRFVHIVEPYWHNVRVDQVIGRARRICSHEDLPEELRTVKVFLYLSVFTETQKTDKKTIEIMIHDLSRIDGRSITTDESLYEISQIKDGINQKILKSIKETSIDCNVYNTKKAKGKDDEQLICYGSNFGKLESNDFISYPTLEKDMSEREELNVIQQKIKLKDTKEINGVKYKIDPLTNELYDRDVFENTKQLVKVGQLKKVGKKMLVELL